MGFEEIWNEYTSSEKDMFQKSVRRLLKQTFIVRDRDEDSKKAYYFVFYISITRRTMARK